MTATLAQIWRHPVKAHGRELVDMVTLEPGKALPWDRAWAVAHERSCFDVDRPGWNPPGDFSRGASSPRLQQIECFLDPAFRTITFTHPDRPSLTIRVGHEGDGCEFIQWVMPISLGARLLPARLVRAPNEAMTDTGYQSISLMNLNTHRALEGHLGRDLSPLRWRGNFLLDGLEPGAEYALVGKRIGIGEAEFEVVEAVGRCRMTDANPETGGRDIDMLEALKATFGHTNFGVYLKVTQGGHVQEGDDMRVIG
jgi:uncharacterized protein YcbX